MGVVKGISASEYPKQGKWLHCVTEVCFNYDSSRKIGGIVVRDDAEAPHLTIIRLDDGRYVLTTECHHTMPRPRYPEKPSFLGSEDKQG
jgi:hypothetical protein